MQPLSIKKQLLLWLIGPLLLLSVISAGITDWLALQLSNEIYDELLINTADSVVARIDYINGRRVIDFPESAEEMFRHHEKDKFYYKIFSQKGRYVSGDEFLPNLANAGNQPLFADIKVDNQTVRTVSLLCPATKEPDGPLIVEVAETVNARISMAHKILFTIMLFQLVIIIGGSAALWIGVNAGLAPLNKIRLAMANRSPVDLEPVTIDRAPPELMPMIDAINALLSELKTYIASQSRFVSDAAHQLRTPLAGIKTFVDLGSKSADDSRSIEIFEQLNIGVGRMIQMVNRLLSLARAEAASDRFQNNTAVNLNAVAEGVVSTAQQWQDKRTTKIHFVPSKEAAVVRGSEQSLRELAENLVHNAVLYTPDGGEISVAVRSNGSVQLLVEDNGPGIPVGEREKVFDRFYRIDKSKHQAGSGLGLSIVREIADKHAATIAISDASGGQGCKFTVTFKSYQNDDEKDATADKKHLVS